MKKSNKILIIIMIVFSLLSTGGATVYAADNNDTVILGGNPFGIKMFSQGLMVIKTEDVKVESRSECPGKEAGIKANDIILCANGIELKSNEELSEIIENSNGECIRLLIRREEQEFEVSLTPVKNSQGIYKAGIWVKDSAAGIGTITFFSDEYNSFCGLGHGICDKDTGMLIPIAYGQVDGAYIASVTKSVDSNVGTLNGYFTRDEIGTASLNNIDGIYGETTAEITGTEIEIASKEEVVTGDAYIYTTVSGQEPKCYEAEILRVNKNSGEADIVIKITDDELLDYTGGIVQGMSGSPIVQNGKLVGAVTHVIVDDVDCGYGIFAESMMDTLAEFCS